MTSIKEQFISLKNEYESLSIESLASFLQNCITVLVNVHKLQQQEIITILTNLITTAITANHRAFVQTMYIDRLLNSALSQDQQDDTNVMTVLESSDVSTYLDSLKIFLTVSNDKTRDKLFKLLYNEFAEMRNLTALYATMFSFDIKLFCDYFDSVSPIALNHDPAKSIEFIMFGLNTIFLSENFLTTLNDVDVKRISRICSSLILSALDVIMQSTSINNDNDKVVEMLQLIEDEVIDFAGCKINIFETVNRLIKQNDINRVSLGIQLELLRILLVVRRYVETVDIVNVADYIYKLISPELFMEVNRNIVFDCLTNEIPNLSSSDAVQFFRKLLLTATVTAANCSILLINYASYLSLYHPDYIFPLVHISGDYKLKAPEYLIASHQLEDASLIDSRFSDLNQVATLTETSLLLLLSHSNNHVRLAAESLLHNFHNPKHKHVAKQAINDSSELTIDLIIRKAANKAFKHTDAISQFFAESIIH